MPKYNTIFSINIITDKKGRNCKFVIRVATKFTCAAVCHMPSVASRIMAPHACHFPEDNSGEKNRNRVISVRVNNGSVSQAVHLV